MNLIQLICISLVAQTGAPYIIMQKVCCNITIIQKVLYHFVCAFIIITFIIMVLTHCSLIIT